MKQQIQQRLQQLRSEYQSGQQMLQDLQQKQANLETTLLRIAGAMQVLEELLTQEGQSSKGEEKEGDSSG